MPAMPTNVPLPSIGFSGVEERTAMRTTYLPGPTTSVGTRSAIFRWRADCAVSDLPPLEPRRPLLQEGACPFLVVLAVERLDAESAKVLAMRVCDAFEDRPNLSLRPAHGQRRIGGDRAEVVVRVGLELRRGHEALNQAHVKRFRSIDRSRRIENVLRIGGADEIHELMHGIEPVNDAEAGSRNAELGPARRKAEIAGHRDRHRAAHTEPEDHGDGGLRADANGTVRGVGLLPVLERGLRVLAVLFELGDVGARGERVPPSAAIHDGANRIVLGEAFGHGGNLGPHRQADRIAHVGTVEGHGRDGLIVFHQDLVAHRFPPGCAGSCRLREAFRSVAKPSSYFKAARKQTRNQQSVAFFPGTLAIEIRNSLRRASCCSMVRRSAIDRTGTITPKSAPRVMSTSTSMRAWPIGCAGGSFGGL